MLSLDVLVSKSTAVKTWECNWCFFIIISTRTVGEYGAIKQFHFRISFRVVFSAVIDLSNRQSIGRLIGSFEKNARHGAILFIRFP